MKWPDAPKKVKKTGQMEWPDKFNKTNVEAIVRDLDKNAEFLGLWNLFDHY